MTSSMRETKPARVFSTPLLSFSRRVGSWGTEPKRVWIILLYCNCGAGLRPASQDFPDLQFRGDELGDSHLRLASTGQQARIEGDADVAFPKDEKVQEGPTGYGFVAHAF